MDTITMERDEQAISEHWGSDHRALGGYQILAWRLVSGPARPFDVAGDGRFRSPPVENSATVRRHRIA
jgi:hypothetical protein